ncbi:MAG: hypothetical protein LBR71_05770 [Synergistaceae bacterium]|jgi:hypothetical protein|nr:hypothetical protein [Synergistaceae bacterium]
MRKKAEKRSALFSFAAASFAVVLALAAFFAPLASPRRAEAGDPNRIAELTAEITALETTIYMWEYLQLNPVKEQMEQEIQRVTTWAAYYNFLVQRDKRLEQEYRDDHAMLKDIVWKDRTPLVKTLYGQLAQAGAQSFADSVNMAQFDAADAGYRAAAGDSYIRFSELYKERMADWGVYAKGVLDANESEALSVGSFQPPLEGIEGLKNASVNAGHYMQLLQAGNQIYNMNGQLTERLRIDVNRQTEARARFLANERQEKTDERAAFNQAIRWKSQTQGQGY